jgi:hypothetical protein
MSRWSKSGTLACIFVKLQELQIVQLKPTAASLDSTSIRVHPDGTGALKKMAHNPLEFHAVGEQQKFIWLPQMINVH